MGFFDEIDNTPTSKPVQLPAKGGKICTRWVHRATGAEETALRIASAKAVKPGEHGDKLWRARLIAEHTRDGQDPNSPLTFSSSEKELERIMGLGCNIVNELIAAIEEVNGHGEAFYDALKKNTETAGSTSSAVSPGTSAAPTSAASSPK